MLDKVKTWFVQKEKDFEMLAINYFYLVPSGSMFYIKFLNHSARKAQG